MYPIKNIISALTFLLLAAGISVAQPSLKVQADDIVGIYEGKQGSDCFKAKISRSSDGKYMGQIIWLEHDRDANGNKLTDAKNPDKKLRSTPADRIVVFSGLSFNASRQRWDDAKIYDPQRGIRANMVADFVSAGRLRIKGSLFGISETVYWNKIKSK